MILVGIRMLLAGFLLVPEDGTTTLEEQLSREGAVALARAAAADGDPAAERSRFISRSFCAQAATSRGRAKPGWGPTWLRRGKR